MDIKIFRVLLVLVIMNTTLNDSALAGKDRIDLGGRWGLQLDPDNKGKSEGWFNNKLDDSVKLPGTLDENKKGEANTEVPEFKRENLLRLTRKYKYIGAAWYQRQIVIPKNWSDKRITLHLERVLWESRVWVDDNEIGMQESLIAPHVYDISKFATAGKHTLTIRIDNSYKHNVGSWDNHPGNPLGHAYTAETQTVWNGIIGDIFLQATDKIYVKDVQVYPDLDKKLAKVKINIANGLGGSASGTLTLKAKSTNSKKNHKVAEMKVEFSVDGAGRAIEVDYPMGEDFLTWDEFSPALYDLTILCETDSGFKNEKTVRFGMREFKADGTVFAINDKRIFLRGTLECCIFPLTGHPPMDVKDWQSILKTARSYGLNHLRFHSWCPPAAAFEAADLEGFYFQVELPVWIQNAGKEPSRDKYMKEEGYRILAEYGNHPSFCLMSMGNEIMGDYDFLHKLVDEYKAQDDRHLYTTTTYSFQGDHGKWPEKVDDFFVTQQTLKGWVRGQGFVNQNRPSTDYDYAESMVGLEVPLVTHEIGQATIYPNMDEIEKYKGVLKPLNFMSVKKDLVEKDMFAQAKDFTNSTGQFAVGLYKAEIELALRTKGTTGFQLLDLHDFPGQGTALIGILDAFWDSKGLIKPEGFRRFCSETVPLARMAKRVYENDETFKADVEVAHFGREVLKQAQTVWTIKDSKGRKIASGNFDKRDIPLGNGIKLGSISVDLDMIERAEKLDLEVAIKGTDAVNNWNFWVYPAEIKTETGDIFVSDELNEEAIAAIGEGKKILLLAKGQLFEEKIAGRYTPVFWSPVHFSNQPGTMGVLCDPKHPALKHFPTDYHTDWQWWDLNINSVVMILDDLPKDIKPIVQIVDNFARNSRLGTVFEVKVGDAAIIVCSMDLVTDLEERPEARQLKYSLVEYMKSNNFAPKVEVELDQLKGMFKEGTTMVDAKIISCDSSAVGHPPEHAIDNNPATMWHTSWSPEKKKHPHEIVIDFGKEMELKGFTYLPRQDGNINGLIAEYEFYASLDSNDWGKAAAVGSFEKDHSLKKVMFDSSYTGNVYSDEAAKARYIRLVVTKGFGDDPYTAIAELDVITD